MYGVRIFGSAGSSFGMVSGIRGGESLGFGYQARLQSALNVKAFIIGIGFWAPL